jgi:hypothetical protein
VFIAHAEEDVTLAEAIKTMISSELRMHKNRILVSSVVGDIKAGTRWREGIDKAHEFAAAIVVLMTPTSIHRPWPMFEAGGGHFKGLPLFVVVANGLSPSCLPSPLQAWHADNLSNVDAVRALLRVMAQKLHRSKPNLKTQTIRTVVRLSQGIGHWEFVHPALAGDRLHRSPFNLHNILAQRLPQDQIFIAGHNLYHLTGKRREPRYKELLFSWLREEKTKRCIQMLICNPEKNRMVAAWSVLSSDPYRKHLEDSVKVFKRWRREARREQLNLEIRVVDLVPLSATFVDPEAPTRGLLVLTPVIASLSAKRPHFIVWSGEHPHVFDYYWAEYSFRFDEGIPVEDLR